MKKLIYISGSVTKTPRIEALIRFYLVELFLNLRGHETINPMRIVPKNATWHEAMKICLEEIENCDAIYLLSNWKKSDGAKLELKKAIELNKHIF